MTYTCASLFSGGGGFDIGAKAAGFTPVCANEYDPAIAAVYASNLGDHIFVCDFLNLRPYCLDCRLFCGSGCVTAIKEHAGHRLEIVKGHPAFMWKRADLLHASPPCVEFSAAKTNGKEGWLELAFAVRIAEFVAVFQPRWFTLENVRSYRKSASFAIICKALADNGYWYDAPILNAADFGVPQTRQRLMLRAVQGGMVPPLPPPTRWIGWNEAIADIIDTLPESEFAEWQLKRLPKSLTDSTFFSNQVGTDDDEGGRKTELNRRYRAILFSRTELVTLQSGDMVGRVESQPSMTVVASDGERPSSMARALILKGSDKWTPIAESQSPIFTIGASAAEHPNRAFILGAQAQTEEDEQAEKYKNSFIVDGKPLNYAGDLSITPTPTPTPTITSTQDKHPFRAFLMRSQNAGQQWGDQITGAEEPAITIDRNEKPRAWLSQGRVVKMTPRALARFQSFPDSYVLPAKASLACRIIGNAVPPLLAEAVCRSLVC